MHGVKMIALDYSEKRRDDDDKETGPLQMSGQQMMKCIPAAYSFDKLVFPFPTHSTLYFFMSVTMTLHPRTCEGVHFLP